MSGLIGIGSDVVVVADPTVLRKAEQSQQNETDNSRGQGVSEAPNALVENDGEARQNGEVDKNQNRERRAEDFEPERVEILRERTMQDNNILVEDFSTGEL